MLPVVHHRHIEIDGVLDGGHFALEKEAPRIATLIDAFLARIAT